jgi:hypothetical protein
LYHIVSIFVCAVICPALGFHASYHGTTQDVKYIAFAQHSLYTIHMVEPYSVATIVFGTKTIVTSIDVTKHQGPVIVTYEQAIDAFANQYIKFTHH